MEGAGEGKPDLGGACGVEGRQGDAGQGDAEDILMFRLRHAFDGVPGPQVNRQPEGDAAAFRHPDDADAAHFQKSADGFRGIGDEGSVFGGKDRLVIGDEGGSLADEAEGEIGFSAARFSPQKDGRAVDVDACAMQDEHASMLRRGGRPVNCKKAVSGLLGLTAERGRIQYGPMSSRGKGKRGVSLVELAIVLIIVGIIAGGVLKGIDLIESARANRIILSLNQVQNAWGIFKAENRRFPGDANRDSQISGGAETVAVWNDLASTGQVAGISPCPSCLSNSDGRAGLPFPSGHFRGAVIDAINLSPYGFWFRLRGIDMPNVTSGSIGNQAGGDIVPVRVIARIDRRMDDGRSQFGYIQTVRQGTGCYGTNWASGAPDYQRLDPLRLCKLYFSPTQQEGRM